MTDMIVMPKDRPWKMYLASGWFSPMASLELDLLEEYFGNLSQIDLAAPRQIFVVSPDSSQEEQESTFRGNLEHIETADFVLVNTRDKDIGTIWEAGYAYAHNKPIVYYCSGLPDGAKFNIMLSRSGVKVCTSFKELKSYMSESFNQGALTVVPYESAVE